MTARPSGMGETRSRWRWQNFVFKKSKREVEETGLQLLITEGGKQGKRKVIATCSYLEHLLQASGERFQARVETLRVDLRPRTEQLGAKKKEVRCEILACQEKWGLPEKIT